MERKQRSFSGKIANIHLGNKDEAIDHHKYLSSQSRTGLKMKIKSKSYWLKWIMRNAKIINKIALTSSKVISSSLKQQH